MKAHEFIYEEIIDEWSETHPGIKKELESKGYKLLGTGVDQMAFLEPGTSQVLKIFGTQRNLKGRPDEFSDDHRMFLTFAEYCMKNKNNPFLPKFFGYESFVYDHKNYLQIRQERLQKSGDLGYTVANMGDYLYWKTADPDELIRSAEKHIAKEGNIDPDVDYAYDDDDEAEYPSVIKFLNLFGKEQTLLLLKTLETLVEIGNDNGWQWDLHRLNVMRRGEIPVLVDPWVCRLF